MFSPIIERLSHASKILGGLGGKPPGEPTQEPEYPVILAMGTVVESGLLKQDQASKVLGLLRKLKADPDESVRGLAVKAEKQLAAAAPAAQR